MATPADGPERARFVLVDVFAERPLTGNPLALVPDADRLGPAQMQAMAREFNQSETTFLLSPTRDGVDWRLRSFTPAGAEVGGAGHNALGAWLWLAHVGRVRAGVFTQEIGDEVLSVEVVHDGGATRVVMTQTAPEFGAVVDANAALAAALGLEVADLDQTLPAQVVSTGAGHLLVPVVDRGVVDRARPDVHALAALLGAADGEGCYVFTTASSRIDDGAHAYARFFNPTMGIGEDPATGTAAGPLAAALVRAGRIPDDSTAYLEQGHAIGRPSRLRVDVSGDLIRLSGSGLVVGEGELRL